MSATDRNPETKRVLDPVVLPNRRRQETRRFNYPTSGGDDRFLLVSVGEADDGRAGEVFVTGPKVGSELRFAMEDGCILASKLRQAGMRFADMAALLSSFENKRPASPLAAIVRVAAAVEAGVATDEFGNAISSPPVDPPVDPPGAPDKARDGKSAPPGEG